ncbi:hypothetical protein CNBF2760 [Cryptococcus deneoformans B-3501A]|uniref:hypothetical protein n=1 Tax=Cryptococcus deneoformans (strain B-3501A) TaxID=283643 RepID=UPI000042C151|nr:hypothetical protein CNBF2760 [Cryptococcus neoformans var. neoformans B-3501A]EAL19949.1 hypothetical protein CNBF2760 [Cryptococcus neoformans var. neoformans B-3501A]
MDRSDCSTAANDQADEAHVEDCLDTNHDARAGGTSTAEKQCRICFSGPEEEDALGRLISPWNTGHMSCINAWRGTGANAKAFMECPQCNFRYQIRRTRISGLATSKPILLLFTFFLFSILSLTLGSILRSLLAYSTTSRTLLSSSPPINVATPFDLFGGEFVDRGGGVVIVGGSGALVWDIVLAAVQTFASLADRMTYFQSHLHDCLPGPIAVFVSALFVRFFLGLAVLGSLSFISLSISLSLFGPLQLANALRGGFIGSWGRRRLARNGRDGGIGTVIVVILVVIGAINTLRQVYEGVGRLAIKLLKYLETQILEVNPDEIRRSTRPTGERSRAIWYEQLRTWNGWKEMGYRCYTRVEGWLQSLWAFWAPAEHEHVE